MHITDLVRGETAPDDRDRIAVTRLPSGKFEFAGVVRTGAVQAHFADHRVFETYGDARDAGVAWAEEKGATDLLVETADA